MPERAAGGQRAGRQRPGVAVAAQFRQRHLAHRRGGGQRRAADRAEARARADRRHRDPALLMAHERADKAEQRTGQPAMGGELPHQQEQRNHHQVVIRQPRIREILERIEQRRGVAPGQIQIPAGADDEHRDADRHADDHQRQHHAKDHEADFDAAQGRPRSEARSQ